MNPNNSALVPNPKEFVPVKKRHTTTLFTGKGEVRHLPVTRLEDGTMNSVWALPSFWQRLRFLFRGEITLRVAGNGHPPVAIVAGDIITEALEAK